MAHFAIKSFSPSLPVHFSMNWEGGLEHSQCWRRRKRMYFHWHWSCPAEINRVWNVLNITDGIRAKKDSWSQTPNHACFAIFQNRSYFGSPVHARTSSLPNHSSNELRRRVSCDPDPRQKLGGSGRTALALIMVQSSVSSICAVSVSLRKRCVNL